MDKLTYRDNKGIAHMRLGKWMDKVGVEADKLAAYEDTGYSPAEIARLKAERDAAIIDLNELRKRTGWKCFSCYYDKNHNRDICASCGINNDNNWEWRGLEAEK